MSDLNSNASDNEEIESKVFTYFNADFRKFPKTKLFCGHCQRDLDYYKIRFLALLDFKEEPRIINPSFLDSYEGKRTVELYPIGSECANNLKKDWLIGFQAGQIEGRKEGFATGWNERQKPLANNDKQIAILSKRIIEYDEELASQNEENISLRKTIVEKLDIIIEQKKQLAEQKQKFLEMIDNFCFSADKEDNILIKRELKSELEHQASPSLFPDKVGSEKI